MGTAAIKRAEAITEAQSGDLIEAFTARERACAALLVRGLGESEIAAALGISATTVRVHLDNARQDAGEFAGASRDDDDRDDAKPSRPSRNERVIAR